VQRSFDAPSAIRGRAGLVFLVLIALAAAGAWWYFAPQTMPGWLARTVPSSPSLGPPLYKWRDAQGRLHVTDKPPADRPYETVRYDPNTNVVPSAAPKN
jgi:transposase